MPGLRGMTRVPRADTRSRRNAANLAAVAQFTDAGQVIYVTDEGFFAVQLGAAGDKGLKNNAGALEVELKASGGLTVDANGLFVVECTTTVLGAVKKQTVIAAAGNLTDSSGGTPGSGTIAAIAVTVTDPADTPLTADALRDDLVTNALAEIRTTLSGLRDAVATLAQYADATLKAKINAMLTAEKTALQMATS